jgi:hypothetical protein
MKTLLIVADQFHGEAKLFHGKDSIILEASYLIPDDSSFDDCYRLFSQYSEIKIVINGEASSLAERVKKLAVRGGFTGSILATICKDVNDIPTLLLPENAANFTSILKPYSYWPAIKKEAELQSKESFPLHCLPEAAREFITAVSDSCGTPIDFAAVAALGCMSGAVGASCRIEIKSGWQEYPVLWCALVAEAGSGKSPVVSLVMKPLREIQGELSARFQQATKNHDPEKDDEKPSLEVLLYGDVTQEGLLKSLASSQRGGLLLSDELVSWTKSFDKYSKGGGSDRASNLSLWSSTPVSVLRKQDGIIFIPIPVLSIVGGLTASSLPSLHGNAEDGFMSRFLISCPDKRKQTYSKIGVSEGAQYAWQIFIKSLWNIEPETSGGVWMPKTIKMSADAEELFEKFFNDIHTVIDSETLPSLFRGSFSKAPSQAARLALVLHLGRQACGEEASSSLVSAETMDAAIQITNYFLGHLTALESGFSLGASRAEGIRQKILGWLKRHGARYPNKPARWTTLRHDCRAALSNGELINDRLLEQTLESLQEQGFIRLQAVESIGGRNSKPEIVINPNL